jgi:hypothetical protein
MTLTLSAANLRYFIKNSCSDFLAKAHKCHIQDSLDEWKISNFQREAEIAIYAPRALQR